MYTPEFSVRLHSADTFWEFAGPITKPRTLSTLYSQQWIELRPIIWRSKQIFHKTLDLKT